MESAIVSLICIALILLGGMTLSQGFLTSIDTSSAGLEEMSKTTEGIIKTQIYAVSATQPAADTVEVTLRNSGQTKLNDFANWDIIVQYYDAIGGYHVKWIPYVDNSPSSNEWTENGIYLDSERGTLEVFDPGILNPGEEVVLELKLDPSVGENTTNLVVATTPNGIPATITFAGK